MYILYYILYYIYYIILSYYISNFSSFYILIFIIIYYTISTIFHSSIHSFSSPFLYNHQTIISFSIFYILPLFYIAYTIQSSTLLYISITFHNLFKTISNLYILFYIFIIITIHFINIQPISYSVSTISYSIILYSTKEEFSLTNFIYILNQINQLFLQAFYKLDFVLTNYIPLLELVQPLFLYISFLTHFSSFFIFFIFQPIIFRFHSNFNFVYSLSSFLYIILIALILHPILHSTSHSPLFITNYSQIIDFDFSPLLISFSSPHPILIDLYSSTIYFILHFHPLHYDITQFSPLFILFFLFHLLISFL